MATTRLRKTFKYPAEEDSDSEPEDLDEEEQEQLINEYIEQDAKKTQGYQRAFLTLPLLLPVLYVPSLIAPTPTSTPYSILLPAITSFLSTAYALYRIPTRFQATAPQVVEDSPLRKYLDHLNALLCIVLLPFAYKAKHQGRVDDVWFAVMPGVVFVLIYVVRTQLKPVDVGELERLKYGYKGA